MIWALDRGGKRWSSTHIRLPLSSVLDSLLLVFHRLDLWYIAEGVDECLDISPSFLENHRTNGPIVGVSIRMIEKEVIRENAGRRCVPWIARSPCKMESERVSSAACFTLRIPASNILGRDSVFEPIVVVD